MPITVVAAEPIEGAIRRDPGQFSGLSEGNHHVLIRLADEAGRVGLGEASTRGEWTGETPAGAVALVRAALAPLVVGSDPFDLAWTTRRLDEAVVGNSAARCALEMALLDLQGQTLNVPVCKLLGGRDSAATRGIRLHFPLASADPARLAERARTLVQRGWKAIVLRLGRAARADADRVRAVREAVGPDVLLSVDGDNSYTTDEACWLARRLADLDVALFEQPTRRDPFALVEVRQRAEIPIAAVPTSPGAALDLLRAQAADVLRLVPGRLGGLRIAQVLARVAEVAGVPCTLGGLREREVGTAALAGLAASTPNLDDERFPADLVGPLYCEKPLAGAPLVYRDDRLLVPDGPGLGVAVGTPAVAP